MISGSSSESITSIIAVAGTPVQQTASLYKILGGLGFFLGATDCILEFLLLPLFASQGNSHLLSDFRLCQELMQCRPRLRIRREVFVLAGLEHYHQ